MSNIKMTKTLDFSVKVIFPRIGIIETEENDESAIIRYQKTLKF